MHCRNLFRAAFAAVVFVSCTGAKDIVAEPPNNEQATDLNGTSVRTLDDSGFLRLFDGKSLAGWQAADMSWWSVEDGAITASITKEKPCNENQYLFCQQGEMHDFELKLVHRIVSEHNVNGGFQFRSEHYQGDDCKGYQVDNNTQTPWLVRLYDEFGRHTLAWRGERTRFDEDGEKLTDKIASAQGPPHFDLGQWHEYHLICHGTQLTLYVNGTLVAEVIDDDPAQQDLSGLLALQLHSGPPMKVQFKHIRYKALEPSSGSANDDPGSDARLETKAKNLSGGETDVTLLTGRNLSAWRGNTGAWTVIGDAAQDADDSKRLVGIPGVGVILNGTDGRTHNLISRDEWSDIVAHVEFMIPAGSNSGVYFMGRYELQIDDSYGVQQSPYPGIECGGIYQRWDERRTPKGFEGHSPRKYVSKPPGQWQSFDVVFRAPRFDASGKKVSNAKFEKVLHNGVVIHEDVELTGPTRAATYGDEKAVGPLMLQGDHGPIAYRNIRISSADPALKSSPTNLTEVATALTGSQSGLRWQRSESSVALLQGDHLVWQFQHGPTLNTPLFHPVATIDGRVLTWDQPPDHAWHHGLWFNWKYLNGVNYWEHNARTGKPDGQTEWQDVEVQTRADHGAVISMTLNYHPQNDAQTVLSEHRQIAISPPDSGGVYHMDWTCVFTAGDHAVDLDRTPPKEQSWGGYAGLSVRFAEGFREREVISDEGPVEFGAGDRHRGRAHAMDYSGSIDGQPAGLALLDHPQNPRYPTPWYTIRGPVMSYINAALLNDEPLRLEAREPMTLRYRVIIHPNRWNAEQLRAAQALFQQNSPLAPPAE